MKQWHAEIGIFIVAAVGAFGLAYGLAQTVGLHPLIIPPVEMRQRHWMVAVACMAFVVAFDALVLFLISLKHRRQASAAIVDRGPTLLR